MYRYFPAFTQESDTTYRKKVKKSQINSILHKLLEDLKVNYTKEAILFGPN